MYYGIVWGIALNEVELIYINYPDFMPRVSSWKKYKYRLSNNGISLKVFDMIEFSRKRNGIIVNNKIVNVYDKSKLKIIKSITKNDIFMRQLIIYYYFTRVVEDIHISGIDYLKWNPFDILRITPDLLGGINKYARKNNVINYKNIHEISLVDIKNTGPLIKKYSFGEKDTLYLGIVDSINVDYITDFMRKYKPEVKIIYGGAGTGKTTKLIDKVNKYGDSCVIMTPTGKSMNVVRNKLLKAGYDKEYIDSHLSTIHSGYYNAVGVDKSILIIDESSMLSYELFKLAVSYTEALVIAQDEASHLKYEYLTPEKSIPRSSVKKIYLYGDSTQLPPIDNGSVFKDFIKLSKIRGLVKRKKLEKIYRQKHIEILNYIYGFRNSQEEFSQLTYEINCYESLRGELNELSKYINYNKYQIIAPDNQTVDKVNNIVGKYYKREKRIFKRNIYYTETNGKKNIIVANGSIVEVIEKKFINIKSLCGSFDIPLHADICIRKDKSGIPILFTIQDLNSNNYFKIKDCYISESVYKYMTSPAYCITVHKSQGSEWNRCIVVFDRPIRLLLNYSLFYTALTRAKKRLFILYKTTETKQLLRVKKKIYDPSKSVLYKNISQMYSL